MVRRPLSVRPWRVIGSMPGGTEKRTKWERAAVAVAIIIVLGLAAMFSLSFTAKRPDMLGVTGGKLAPCPSSPNCVSTQASDAEQRMEPVAFAGDGDDALSRLRTIIDGMPGGKVITCRSGYLQVEFTSRLFRFVDDVEFLVDDEKHIIHFRSASRVGYSDLGANRRRMTRIRDEFAQQLSPGSSMSPEK